VSPGSPVLRRFAFACLLGCLAFFAEGPSAGFAFYESETPSGHVDLRGFLSLSGAASRNPDSPGYYSSTTDASGAGVARLLASGRSGDHLRLELNVLQGYVTTTSMPVTAASLTAGNPERSATLEWAQRQSSETDARLAADRLNATLSADRIDLTIGRQPINLATAFYFTPNDFFAPFAPQAFFRVFKPGVDAARAEVRLGPLSQLSLIGVLGYDEDPSGDNGYDNHPDTRRASGLLRISVTQLDFEWAVLSGTVHGDTIAGGSLQGEVWDWLGIRGEGHYAHPRSGGEDSSTRISLDLEHRFENSLSVRVEQYYNSDGYRSVSDFNERIRAGEPFTLFGARHYTALDLSFEATPLLTVDALSIFNWIDRSVLLSFYSVYSLTDEMELSPGFSIPVGNRTETGNVESEFGLLPYAVSVDWRWYF
jgi:hypothetical protein